MRLLITLIVLLFIFVLTCNVYATTVNLQWDYNPPMETDGYYVYMKRDHSLPYDKIGTTTLNTFQTEKINHPIGTYLYFVVTAYWGMFESSYSNEVYVYRPNIPSIAIPKLISKP